MIKRLKSIAENKFVQLVVATILVARIRNYNWTSVMIFLTVCGALTLIMCAIRKSFITVPEGECRVSASKE